MTVITTPVTTGGKKRMIRAKNGVIGQPDQGRDHHRAEDRRQTTVAGDDRDQRGHAGERRALHQRQPRAEPRDADRLQDGGQAADEEAAGHQQAELGRRDTGGAADDQRRRDDAAVHGENVLGAEAE